MTNEPSNDYPRPDAEAADDAERPMMPAIMPAPTFEGLAIGGPVSTQGIAGEQGAEIEGDMDDVAP
jgi:hypothetical protein